MPAYDVAQLEAITRSCDLKDRIVAVTGQAGTGKTTIIKEIYDKLIAQNYRIAVAAPTGKAAQRIQQATGIEAVTVHRLLEYPHPGEVNPKTGRPYKLTDPKRNKWNPLEENVLLIDEYAMVNRELHDNIIFALPAGGCLRMFGDANQLPPIEQSKVLANSPSAFLTALKKFNGITLEKTYRQNEGNAIIENAHKILHGRVPHNKDEFKVTYTDHPIKVLKEFLLEMMLEHDICFNTLDNQIITPSNQTWIGTAALNTVIQNIYMEQIDGWLTLPRHEWAKDKTIRVNVGDKVIFCKNNYDLGIFNGETGIVIDANTSYGDVTIDFDGKIKTIPPIQVFQSQSGLREFDPRKDIELAYAITTHKAQGSEFKHVVYMMNKSIIKHLFRGNFYTGITRARSTVNVITDQRSVSVAVRNTQNAFLRT